MEWLIPILAQAAPPRSQAENMAISGVVVAGLMATGTVLYFVVPAGLRRKLSERLILVGAIMFLPLCVAGFGEYFEASWRISRLPDSTTAMLVVIAGIGAVLFVAGCALGTVLKRRDEYK